MNLPYRRFNMGMMGGGGMMCGMGMMGEQPTSSNEPIVLGTLEYAESGRSMPLPTRLVSVEPLPEANEERQLVFAHGMMCMGGDTFTINGLSFDPERTDTIVKVGTVEEWEIVNGGGMMMMDFDHPFHIHTNAFQVVSENGQSPRFSAWRDIVNVPMGESVRIRIPFQDFPGRTVYHCHILDHEDLGMMAVIEMRA
jgi:FtsP/CotA-like multicopper oxidase with cupredoxin domain